MLNKSLGCFCLSFFASILIAPAGASAQVPTLTDPAASAVPTAEPPAVPTVPQPAAAAPADQNAQVPADAQDAMQVLDQGPIHEAFAEPIVMDPAARATVDHEPPAPINEIPPDVKPEGQNVQWIPGYWMWSPDKNDFIWVSGVWRDIPPGRRWVPGHWVKADAGYQWSPGFWADQQRQKVQMLPLPPESLEVGPSSPAPAANYFWIPGIWSWQSGAYAWRPGYWYLGQANWVWVPDHYCYTPFGAIFVNGYWDYPLASRGLLYAPVWWSRPVYGYTGFYYRPYNAINTALLLSALFVNGRYQHYYYGYGNWWNGGNWGNNGFYPWWAWNRHRHGYDPFYAYHHWHDGRNNRDWDDHIRRDFNRHQQQFADTRGQMVNGGNNRGPNRGGQANQQFNRLIKPADLIARDNRNLVLKKLEPKERQAALEQVRDWQRIRDARQVAENNAAKHGGADNTRNPSGRNAPKNENHLQSGNKVVGQGGAKVPTGDAAAKSQARLRIDAPNGPRAAFQLPPSKNASGAGGNRLITRSDSQGQGTQIQNQNQGNQADQLQKFRDQVNSRFGGNRGGADAQVDSALRQFNRGNAAGQQQSAAGQSSNPFVPRNFHAGDNRSASGRGNATPGDAGNAGASQLYRAARPQIDFSGPRSRVEPSPFSQQGGNPFNGSGPSNFRFGNRSGGSMDAANQIFRGTPNGSVGGASRSFRMPSNGDSSGVRIPSGGGGSSIRIPSGGQNPQQFRRGDASGVLRSFNAGGNRGPGGGGAALQGGQQLRNLPSVIGGGGGGGNNHRHDRRQ